MGALKEATIMLICKRCKGQITPGDDYAKDDEKIICMDCIVDHILVEYDILDIARDLGIDILECEEDPEPEEKPEPQIPGQIDIFGNITT